MKTELDKMTTELDVKDINQYLICSLCLGYLRVSDVVSKCLDTKVRACEDNTICDSLISGGQTN